MKINVLGTEYTIITNEELLKLNGSCDYTTKIIKISKELFGEAEADEVQNKYVLIEKILRHEIIHALHYEGGLFMMDGLVTETLVEWFAIMSPKLEKIMGRIDVQSLTPKVEVAI